MFVDTHCHLTSDDYENLDEVIKEMDGIMITSGCNDKSNREVLDLVKKYKNVYGTLGIHPEEIDSITEESFKLIEDSINNPKIVGIGEIGLDYYWTRDNIDKQKQVFEYQVSLAEKYGVPIVVHSREAIQDTYDILKKYKVKGSIHCFSSSLEMAKKFIKLGYKIGIGGTLTFKNSKKIQDIVEKIDVSDILIETDSPYLSPEPFRGKKNKPSNVYYVALKISEIKNVKISKILEITRQNAIKTFDLNL